MVEARAQNILGSFQASDGTKGPTQAELELGPIQSVPPGFPLVRWDRRQRVREPVGRGGPVALPQQEVERDQRRLRVMCRRDRRSSLQRADGAALVVQLATNETDL